MPNPFTSLRREVLLDVLNEQTSPVPVPLPSRVIEAGGSGSAVVGSDGTSGAGGGDSLAGMEQGENYLQEPVIGIDPNNTLYFTETEFDSVTQRFEVSDSFLANIVSNFVYSLRVVPQGNGTALPSPLTAISVKKTGLRPFIFAGHVFVYPGGTKDLASYVSGFPNTNCLITLTPSAIPSPTVFDALGAAINVITDSSIVGTPANWPKTQMPLAIVYLDSTWSTTEGVSLASIFDVRPMVAWGNDLTFIEKDWSSVTLSHTRRYNFDTGVFPALPYPNSLRVDRNGQMLKYGSANDYTVAYDSGAGVYYLTLNFDIVTGESLRSWFIEA